MSYKESYDLYIKLKNKIDSEEINLNSQLNSLRNQENNLNNNISQKNSELDRKKMN